MDLSHLDKKYFIDSETYNCPYCKRNNVPYEIASYKKFDWNNAKKCFTYFTTCSSCKNTSLHWSWEDILQPTVSTYIFDNKIEDLDSQFFFHQPTSFFTLDSRIPERIRQLVNESEKCRSANSLVGASACMRKAIYELLNIEGSIVYLESQERADYTKSVEKLQTQYPQVDSELFNILKQIKELASDLLHESSWESWSSSELIQLTELLKVILSEIYLRKDEENKISKFVSGLRKSLLEDKASNIKAKEAVSKNIDS